MLGNVHCTKMLSFIAVSTAGRARHVPSVDTVIQYYCSYVLVCKATDNVRDSTVLRDIVYRDAIYIQVPTRYKVDEHDADVLCNSIFIATLESLGAKVNVELLVEII